MRHIYLDYNAATPLAPDVQEAIIPFLAEFYGVPGSAHWLGRAAAEAVEDARSKVASLIGADRDEIVFTSGGTESLNLAIKGVMLRRRPIAGHLVISALEHAAVSESAKFLESWGCDVTVAPCTAHGVVSAANVEAAIRPETALVCVTHANHEIGTLQPIQAIAQVCRNKRVPLLVDASQTAGRIAIDVDELDIDYLAISGHKMYAPKGSGALFVRSGMTLEPQMHGNGNESGMRSGTENTAAIVGFGRAAALAKRSLEAAGVRMAKLRDRLLADLCAAIGAPLRVHGEKALRLPNTLSVVFPGVTAGELLGRAAEVCASATAGGRFSTLGIPPTLAALGLDPLEARGTVRFSLGWYTTEEEIDRAAGILANAWESLNA